MISYINENISFQLLPNDPITCARLTNRSCNALQRANVHTIMDLLHCDLLFFQEVHGLGTNSENEILEFLSHLRLGSNGPQIYPLNAEILAILEEENSAASTLSYFLTNPRNTPTPLEDMNFSARAYNCLRQAGYASGEELIGISREKLLRIKNLGCTTADEILSILQRQRLNQVLISVSQAGEGAAYLCSYIDYLQKLSPSCSVVDAELVRDLLPYFEQLHQSGGCIDFNKLLQIKRLRNIVKERILRELSDHPFGLNRDMLQNILPEHKISRACIDQVLHELQADSRIRTGDKITLQRMSIKEYVEGIQDTQLRSMIQSRLSGAALHHIGKAHRISREWVRQKISQCLRNRSQVLEEDKYIPVYEKYKFSKDSFLKAYNESEAAYYYLNIICVNSPQNQRRPLSELRNDKTLPEELRQGADNLVHKSSLCIDGIYVESNRLAVVEYVIQTHFKNAGTYCDFCRVYKKTLQDVGLEQHSKYVLNKQFEKQLLTADFILCSPGSRLRWYDIKAINFTEFMAQLHLENYHNAEYSTHKIFTDHLELMREYDIRDEYELHNLLRKICKKYGYTGIRFLRMPLIVFGQADRYQQVYRLISANSPISKKDLITIYEQKYGVHRRTVNASFLSPFLKYYRCGVYDLTASRSDKQGRVLRKIPVDDL